MTAFFESMANGVSEATGFNFQEVAKRLDVAAGFNKKKGRGGTNDSYGPQRPAGEKGSRENLEVALELATSNVGTNTDQLQKLYNKFALDSTFAGARNILSEAVLNSRMAIIDKTTGQIDEEISENIEGIWLNTLINHILDSWYFWYSLTAFKHSENRIEEVYLVNRGNIIPNAVNGLPILKKKVFDTEGLTIDPSDRDFLFSNWGEEGHLLGYLHVLAYDIITIREFKTYRSNSCEKHINPLAVVSMDPNALSQTATNELKEVMGKMGTQGGLIVPESVKVDVHHPRAASNYDIFEGTERLCQENILKVVLGQTMTMNDGASRAQSETHQNTYHERLTASRRRVQHELNAKLLPRLRKLDYSLTDKHRFKFVDNMTPEQSIKIDKVLLDAGVILSKEYLEKTYNVNVEELRSNNTPVKNEERKVSSDA